MFSHRGVKIAVDSNGRFIASVRETKICEETLGGAKAAIEKAQQAYAKAREVNLKVIGILTKNNYGHWGEFSGGYNPKVHKAVCVGINRTTGDLMFTGVPKDHMLSLILPDTIGCDVELHSYLAAQKAFDKIKDHVKSFVLKGGKGGRIGPDQYEVLIDQLELDYAKAKYEHES